MHFFDILDKPREVVENRAGGIPVPLSRAASADFGRGWGCWAVTELCVVHKSNAARGAGRARLIAADWV